MSDAGGPDRDTAAYVAHLRTLIAEHRAKLDAFRTIFGRIVRGSALADEIDRSSDRELEARGLTPAEVALLREALAPVQNFSWVLAGELAGSAMPPSAEGVRWLATQGVRTLLSLTEAPPPAAWLSAAGVDGEHLPVADFTAPTAEQLTRAVSAIDDSLAGGRPVVVHCAGGFGRTGTVLAAYLVHRGIAPDEAIDRVRRLRPRSIEAPAQEEAVRRFAAERR